MQGQLFSQDFLRYGIRETPPYQALDDTALAAFTTPARALFAGLNADTALNEAQTEQLLIEPLLNLLGWANSFLPQVNMSEKRREDVPDMLLFANASSYALALQENKDERRYRHGMALLEAKRWLRPLDRGDNTEHHDPGAPSSQMLRYLSRADVMSDRAVKWGLLTNGSTWRLYWQDARSRSEEFFELDVAWLLGVPGVQGDLDGIEQTHGLKLLYLLFHRNAFLPQAWDTAQRSLHAYALNEARLYEEKVSQDLGARVFNEIFPALAQALAEGDLQAKREKVGYGSFTRQRFTSAYLEEVREATLILLYRMLFLFYAEDRRLLPVQDPRYRSYSMTALREEVRERTDNGPKWATTLSSLFIRLKLTFELIDTGDDGIGVPAYNGGLFNRGRSALLVRTKVPDAVMAPVIDQLSRRTEDLLRGWINYRDLSVSHLGGIYERLLEYSLVHEVQAEDDYRDLPEINRVMARPASFARKASGSYYTHADLVHLVLRESVGTLARERHEAFDKLVASWRRKPSLNPGDWDRLDQADPASAILELKICDPAMGSGHFLVALVDDMADRVLEAITAAQLLVATQPWAAHLAETGRPWISPLVARIAHIRQSIKAQAKAHGWTVTDAQLDDRHIVRRMVLKKSVFGVDKNLMAVELAKTALWLHTFTVGAPLSFLDHHLKHGDSLHGERLDEVQRGLQSLGTIFQKAELDRLELAAKNLQQVADLTDVDIAEAQLSKKLNDDANEGLAPLHTLLDFWRAMRWLMPGWPVAQSNKLAKLGDEAQRAALGELLAPTRNLVAVLAAGKLEGHGASVEAANALMAQVRALAAQESFFHWWTAFPTAFAGAAPGFDAVIGNPPWDRIKLQEVEWFAERDRNIAAQTRAADRKALIAQMRQKKAPLAADYDRAVQRAESNTRVLAKCGDFPLLGGGDVNLYSLFVERAQALAHGAGLVALLTPSGIAADKGAAEFFKSIATTGRLGALFDFENKGFFFADVHDNFKFVCLVFGGTERKFDSARLAYYLYRIEELADPNRTLTLSKDDFALVNPNISAAPIFRTRRDADITLQIYRNHPVLVRHGKVNESLGKSDNLRVWPVKYTTVFHMTGDSGKFLTRAALVEAGWQSAGSCRWTKGASLAFPLLVGKTAWHFDHRANHASVNTANLHVASSSRAVSLSEHQDPYFSPEPQYWVVAPAEIEMLRWAIGFRDITNPTNSRTAIATIVPHRLAGNTLPLLLPLGPREEQARWSSLLLANFNSFAFDYVARQKAKWTHLNWFILEQLPVITPTRFEQPLPAAFVQHMRQAGLMNGHHDKPSVADFVIPQVLALSYTAHDLAPFARDLGYVDGAGNVLPPIVWDDENRRQRLAALDALFMHLYGLNRDDATHVMNTFPIVQAQDVAAFGHYRTRDDVLALMPLLG